MRVLGPWLAAALLASAPAAAAPAAELGQPSMEQALSRPPPGPRGRPTQPLRQRRAAAPGDSAARVLLGTVLSWDQSYDEARLELQAVLQRNAIHGDALR